MEVTCLLALKKDIDDEDSAVPDLLAQIAELIREHEPITKNPSNRYYNGKRR